METTHEQFIADYKNRKLLIRLQQNMIDCSHLYELEKQKEINNLLSYECEICFQPYSTKGFKIATLSCGHSFCLQCAKQIIERRCPMCRQPFDNVGKNILLCEILKQCPITLPTISNIDNNYMKKMKQIQDKINFLKNQLLTIDFIETHLPEFTNYMKEIIGYYDFKLTEIEETFV